MKADLILSAFKQWFAIEQTPVSHVERIVSSIGGFVAICAILIVSRWFVGSPGAELLVASMGASAVLLFAVPHGTLSQPWAVLGGHLVSACVGVTCAQLIGNEVIAAGAAVGAAIGAMYYLKCIHPPGGATALVAVVGGDTTHALGYSFVITPVLLNVLIILGVAFLFNYLFAWRRYPLYLQHRAQAQAAVSEPGENNGISHGDFVFALSQVDSLIDISEYDLLRIYDLATNSSRSRLLSPQAITLGHAYSNGEYGDDWAVRQIVDESPSGHAEKDMVIYKVMAGKGRRSSGCVTRSAFSRWARHQVVRDEENWKRVPPDDQTQRDQS